MTIRDSAQAAIQGMDHVFLVHSADITQTIRGDFEVDKVHFGG